MRVGGETRIMANFRSDNEAPVAPEIMSALERANTGYQYAYGDDELTAGLTRQFANVFETSLSVFPVATGTGANALALSQLCPPYGAIFCHRHAHIHTDECGAPEFFTGGAKLLPLDGAGGKLIPEKFAEVLASIGEPEVHESRPSAVSISQASEMGIVYSLPEIADIAGVAHKHGLLLHMDGARLANAIHHLGCTPAELSWRAGVDVLSFGATKNGAMLAEAVVIFKKELTNEFERRRKRAGQLLSKGRFIAAQLAAYLDDGLWLRLAGRANRMAALLSMGLSEIDGITLDYPTQANEVFVRMQPALADAMHKKGVEFFLWPGTENLYRLVTSYMTTEDEVSSCIEIAQHLAGG